MKSYPHVRSEEETLQRVLAGASIARYGDGEFKHCDDQRNVSQERDPKLSQRLREILVDSGSCMVGIPNLNGPALAQMTDEKGKFWRKFTYAAKWLSETRVYGSAFITRPDSAPWINTAEYWKAVERLWVGQDVTLVRGDVGKALHAADLHGANVTEVICPRQHAFAEYDAILARVGRPKLAILCLGPTATVMAVELAKRGVHAVDLGHLAMFLRKYRRGERMELTKDDKSHDKVSA